MAYNLDQLRSEQLVTSNDPKSPAAEAYRTLRTNLQFSSLDQPLKTVLVTSSGPGEGKTTITSNLGVAFAQAGKTVIVVGADMRKPTLHTVFGLDNRVGLSNVLTGHVKLENALQKTTQQGLLLLASGPIPPNPAELLGTQRMRELIQELNELADLVIFDAPPVIAVTDAGVLAQLVDGTLFVVSLGTTPRDVAQAAIEQLEQVGARVLGAVVNRLENASGYYYYYYTSYYGDEDTASVPWWRRLFRGGNAGSVPKKASRQAAAVRDD